MKYTWLLFDADSTLFDYDKAEALALQATFEQLGYAFDPAYLDEFRLINVRMFHLYAQGAITTNQVRYDRFEQLSSIIGIPLDCAAFGDGHISNMAGGTYLIDGAQDVISALAKKAKLAIITNALVDVCKPRLAKSELVSYFSDIVSAEEIGVSKPHAGFFEQALGRIGNPPKEEVLVIGDNLISDIKGGHEFGMDTCWFNPQRLPHDYDGMITYEINHLSELLDILK
ncbi:MAG: noncanonical pyrimidine nucleotidase, YjjG family [Chloroflexi bacterium]|jgi:2-haloacid dehalogenase|nr:noncanonical pyrimidine nucleotidase, YjjG family [Chloroflexota bacterium]MBT7081216.1 noncanonical pyrimidine nucleotidase, YjjG family [Chloroflexota bacterium]MBT7290308.1 noncanonical pyrimidine nucleotidase, YjjG family [Chloroflexota bacterium]